MDLGIFISYRYNFREIESIDEFNKELEHSYLCQGVGKWIPSCSEGGEMWMTLFITLPLGHFLVECLQDVAKDVVITSGKKYLLEPLKRAIGKLRKSNETSWGLKIQTCVFKFNDIEVHIGAINQEELERIEKILSKVNEVKDKLNPTDGFQIIRIELPAERLPSNNQYCLDSWRFEYNDLFKSPWIITYADNHKTLYNPEEGKEHDIS